MVNYITGRHVSLVKACAWCPRSTQTKLGEREEYTHGVCDKHFLLLMDSLKKKKTRVTKRKIKSETANVKIRYPCLLIRV